MNDKNLKTLDAHLPNQINYLLSTEVNTTSSKILPVLPVRKPLFLTFLSKNEICESWEFIPMKYLLNFTFLPQFVFQQTFRPIHFDVFDDIKSFKIIPSKKELEVGETIKFHLEGTEVCEIIQVLLTFFRQFGSEIFTKN